MFHFVVKPLKIWKIEKFQRQKFISTHIGRQIAAKKKKLAQKIWEFWKNFGYFLEFLWKLTDFETWDLDFVNLLLKELRFDTPGVKIGLREHFWKIFWRPIHFLISPCHTRPHATDAKKKFQKFWTLDSINGAKVTSAISLDDLYKEDSSILALFLRYWQIHETFVSHIDRYVYVYEIAKSHISLLDAG